MDTLLGMIQDAMPPQAAKLKGFEDRYTKIVLPVVGVALTTARDQSILFDFWTTPQKKYSSLSMFVLSMFTGCLFLQGHLSNIDTSRKLLYYIYIYIDVYMYSLLVLHSYPLIILNRTLCLN